MPRYTNKHNPQPAFPFAPARPAWQLQTAKARFSELFRLVRDEGPQFITRHGADGVVMLAVEQYEQLASRSRQPKSLVQFFRESPLVGLDLDFQRDKDTGGEIEL
jgi:prevent-host-death family protein